MAAMVLGPIQFDSFEIPRDITFGGRQRLAVHQMPGGGRVIDALGADDSLISWQGMFSGTLAGERARQIDALRSGGTPVTLSWDEFVFDVVVARFTAHFEKASWIPYRIACAVLPNPVSFGQPVASLLAQLSGDVAAAAGTGLDVGSASAALAIGGAATAGTVAYGAATAALQAASTDVDTSLLTQSAALDASTDIATAASASVGLAQSALARGYLRRALGNLVRAGA